MGRPLTISPKPEDLPACCDAVNVMVSDSDFVPATWDGRGESIGRTPWARGCAPFLLNMLQPSPNLCLARAMVFCACRARRHRECF